MVIHTQQQLATLSKLTNHLLSFIDSLFIRGAGEVCKDYRVIRVIRVADRVRMEGSCHTRFNLITLMTLLTLSSLSSLPGACAWRGRAIRDSSLDRTRRPGKSH